jgi:hypothetical protein
VLRNVRKVSQLSDTYQILRDDGVQDGIAAGQVFTSYDEAYTVLERYYADLCCSDDREFYRIVPVAGEPPDPRNRAHLQIVTGSCQEAVL